MERWLVCLALFVSVLSYTRGDACIDYKAQSSCLANSSCIWCLSEAVPSICVTPQQAKRLPPQVFICSRSESEFEIAPRDANCDQCKAMIKRAMNWVGCGPGETLKESDCLALLDYSAFGIAFCPQIVRSFNTALQQACAQFPNQQQIDDYMQLVVCKFIAVC